MTPPRRHWLPWLIWLVAAPALSGCDRAPSDAPRPSDPQHTVPKPKALPDLPASQPAP